MADTLLTGGTGTGTLSAAGVGSGLDVSGLIAKLMAVEQRPVTLLDRQEARLQAKLTSLGSIKGALSSLQSAAQTLSSAGTSCLASASDNAILNATAGSSAVAGNYSVSVAALAQTQKLISTGSASMTSAIGNGTDTTLTFTMGTITGGSLTNGVYSGATFTPDAARVPVSITIGSSNNTLTGIRDAINAAAAGVTASLVNDGSGMPYRLSLASYSTGAGNSLKLSVSGDAAIASLLAYDPSTPQQNLTQTQAAQDAQLAVDGVNVTSPTNFVPEAIQGVTLNLAGKTNVNPVVVSVQRNTVSLISALTGLVKAYNDANANIAAVTNKGALFQGDFGVLSLQRQARAILGSVQTTAGAYTTLSQLGVTFQKDGSLASDASRLNSALSANAADVIALAGVIGIAIKTAADNMLGTSGPISSETDGINASIKSIDVRRTNLQQRLELIQKQYQQQFSALDTLLSSMNQTSTFLTQQIAALPKIGSAQ